MAPGSPPGLFDLGDTSLQGQARVAAFQQILTFDTGVALVQPASNTTVTALAQSQVLAGALQGAPNPSGFPSTRLDSNSSRLPRSFLCKASWG